MHIAKHYTICNCIVRNTLPNILFDVRNNSHICRMGFLGMSIDRHVEILEMQFGNWTAKSSEMRLIIYYIFCI